MVLAAVSYVALNRSNPTVPGAPTLLQAVPGDDQVSLTWVAPASDGGSTIEHYVVYTDGEITGMTALTFFHVSDLTNGQPYSFYVRAHNGVGTGPPSNTVSATPSASASSSDTTVSFIDVGQGDSILIETSDSKHILIDAGPESADTTVISYLNGRSVTVIDALIATHPDADHIGGADELPLRHSRCSECTIRD